MPVSSRISGAVKTRPRTGRPRAGRTFMQVLTSLAGAAGIVLLVPFAILLIGVPVALLVRGLVEAIGWLFTLMFL
jgi:hypothetical protein